MPLPSWPELEAGGSSLEGLSGEQLAAFRERAVPEPGAALGETPRLADERRLDVPSIVVCASMSSNQIKAAVEAGHPWVGELAELRDVSYVDLPTGHWPMWSRARELAVILGDVARRSTRRLGGVTDALAGRYPISFRIANWSWSVRISLTLPLWKCQIAVFADIDGLLVAATSH